ncbi:MAG: EAL domain-containing protein, partial [Cyanobacteria bacterium P01_D01_bin.6]
MDKTAINLELQSSNAAIIRAIIALANSLDIATVAEGVETIAERDYVASSGSQFAQGHFFAQPLDTVAAENFLLVGNLNTWVKK